MGESPRKLEVTERGPIALAQEELVASFEGGGDPRLDAEADVCLGCSDPAQGDRTQERRKE